MKSRVMAVYFLQIILYKYYTNIFLNVKNICGFLLLFTDGNRTLTADLTIWLTDVPLHPHPGYVNLC